MIRHTSLLCRSMLYSRISSARRSALRFLSAHCLRFRSAAHRSTTANSASAQPITTSRKCSPSIPSQSVMCIPSPAKFHFYSFLYFPSSRYLHIHLYIIALYSYICRFTTFPPMQPLSPTNFSPKKAQKGYRTVPFCILLYQFGFKLNYSFASSDAISLLMICGLP